MPNPSNTYLGQFIKEVGSLVKLALPLVAAVALLYFFWGVAVFIFKADNDKAREEGKQKMLWGIVALFVMVSVWGITSTLGAIFRVDTHSYGEIQDPGGCDGTDENPC
jgi:hypothetical protein